MDVRQRAQLQVKSLPEELKRLRNPEIYPVLLSSRLAKFKENIIRRTQVNNREAEKNILFLFGELKGRPGEPERPVF